MTKKLQFFCINNIVYKKILIYNYYSKIKLNMNTSFRLKKEFRILVCQKKIFN